MTSIGDRVADLEAGRTGRCSLRNTVAHAVDLLTDPDPTRLTGLVEQANQLMRTKLVDFHGQRAQQMLDETWSEDRKRQHRKLLDDTAELVRDLRDGPFAQSVLHTSPECEYVGAQDDAEFRSGREFRCAQRPPDESVVCAPEEGGALCVPALAVRKTCERDEAATDAWWNHRFCVQQGMDAGCRAAYFKALTLRGCQQRAEFLEKGYKEQYPDCRMPEAAAAAANAACFDASSDRQDFVCPDPRFSVGPSALGCCRPTAPPGGWDQCRNNTQKCFVDVNGARVQFCRPPVTRYAGFTVHRNQSVDDRLTLHELQNTTKMACETACQRDPKCAAYVREDAEDEKGRCWLKSAFPEASAFEGRTLYRKRALTPPPKPEEGPREEVVIIDTE